MRPAISLTAVALLATAAAGQSVLDPYQEHSLCVLPPISFDDPTPLTDVAAEPAALAPLGQTFQLHSRPTASKTIFLDFDGHVTSGTSWLGGATITTPAFDPGNNGPSFLNSELERIQFIWQRVAEDFSPFDVNVTTQQPPLADLRKAGNGDTRWGIRVVIGDNNWRDPAGGVAYVGSFNYASDTPCFVFENHLTNGSEKSVAEAISHEVGHTLGLSHDGRTSPDEEYYAGHGSGNTGWAPIMGVGYGKSLTQWGKGEYNAADQKQDDLSIIVTQNGFGYRPDDHADSLLAATPLTVTGNQVFGSGVISTPTDRDLFAFVHGGGTVNLRADPFERGPNLDILFQLLNPAGTLLATSNPADQLYGLLFYNLQPGTYFLRVDGTGRGDPLATGYSDYGSLGQYTISGTIVPVAIPEPTTLAAACVLACFRHRRRTYMADTTPR